MNVKKLKELLNGLDENTKVIVTGEYGYGTSICSGIICEKVFLDDEVASDPENVLSLNIENYLYESEDIGNCSMYVDLEDAKEFMND